MLQDKIKKWRLQDAFSLKSETKPIDKVTTRHLEIALRLTGIYIDKSILDRVIDMVELLEDKGGSVTLHNIDELKKKWRENNGK